MKQRVLTALLITPVAIAVVLFLPMLAFAALITALCLIASWEWTRLSGLRDRRLRALLLAVALAIFWVLWVWHNSPVVWSIAAIGCVWWCLSLLWLRHFTFAASPSRGNTLFKLLVGVLVIFPAWVALMHLRDGTLGPAWSLYALLLCWSADTFAYLAGSRWGNRKLAPNISPRKTIAGVYGALVGTGIVAAIGGWLLHVRDTNLVWLVLLALLCVGFSIVGDLFESLIKRQSNVKDSGNLFPGHGGVFDRLDSAFAVMPIFVFGKLLLGL